MPRLTAACLIAAAGLVLTAGNIFAAPRVEPWSFQNIDENEAVNYAGEAVPPLQQAEPGRGERVMKALVEAYPRRVEKAEFRNNDWAVLMRGVWYYYAGGKLLPEEVLDRADEYSPVVFYSYQSELPPWMEPSPEQAARFREMSSGNRLWNLRQRSLFFFDALWRARNRNEAYERVKSIRFLGHPVMVHYAILEELSLVEERILAAAKTDSQVRSWVNNINVTEGWGWRNVSGTRSRSYHSYGVAVDILPKSFGGKETYWQWAADKKKEWWNIPYKDRYHPPDAVIRAFESYGFVWGGKWAFFDTMHFEYRPEVFILNGLELAGDG